MRARHLVALYYAVFVVSSTRSLAGLDPYPFWEGSNDTPDRYGWCVSTAGDVNSDGYSDILVCAPSLSSGESDEGGAYVYHGSETGFSSTPDWIGQGNQSNAQYGVHGDAAGDVNGDGYDDIIVGAWGYDGGQDQEGRAFVYFGSATGLASSPSWFGECNRAEANFGHCVASAGDVNADGYDDVLVGAQDYANGHDREGAAFLYFGSASGPSTTANWMIEGNQTAAWLGCSVSSAGDVNGDGYDDIVIGALGFNAGQTDEGRALLFYGSASGPGTTASWTGEGNQADAYYGEAVSLAGDVNGDGYGDVLIGAVGYDQGVIDAGRVFLHLGSASGPQPGIGFGAPVPDEDSSFGTTLRTLGDVNGDGYADVIVGASHYNGGNGDEGGVWGYWGGPGGFDTTPDWHVESGQNAAHLGWGCSGAGDVNGDGYSDAIVGIPDYPLPQFHEGAVWVFHGSQGGLSESVRWENESQQTSAQLGYSVAYAGDVNGDGYGDIVTGAFGFDNGQTDEGRIWVWHGERDGTPVQGAVREIDNATAYFGLSVASAGDVNGDGYDDIVAGAPRYDGGQSDEGAAFVYYGSPSGISSSYNWKVEPNRSDAYFGWSVAGAGDVNGDGCADVLVGAQSYTGTLSYQGAAFLYLGSETGLSTTPAWSVQGHRESAFLGTAVASAGDVNRDGFSDVAVIVSNYAAGNTSEGAAHVYYGSPTGPSASPDWTRVCDQSNARMHVVASAGDVNGDGYGDLILGATRYDGSLLDEGRAWCFHGSASGLASVPNWVRDGGNFAGFFGASVASAGDLDGDGYGDVLVGASRYTYTINLEGAAFAYHGAPGGLGNAEWGVVGEQTDSRCGISVASAGDLNGDGFLDVIVGSDSWDGGQSNEGRVRFYLGNLDAVNGGLDVLPRQRAVDGSPIAWLGKSDEPSRFALRAQARSPMGRERVRMEYQVAELDVSLSGASLHVGDWLDTGAPIAGVGSRVDMAELATGLQSETLHHWRFRIRTNSVYVPTTRWYFEPPSAMTIAHLRTGETSTGVDGEDEEVAAEAGGLRIESVVPNPSPGAARIAFVTPQDGPVQMSVHDAAGRRVAMLADHAWTAAGRDAVFWDGRDERGKRVGTGVYFVRLSAPHGMQSKKLLIEK